MTVQTFVTVRKAAKTHVYLTTLKKTYGLTDRLIAELGEPDLTVKNPHHRSGPPSKLYAIMRVEQFIEKNIGEVLRVRGQRAARSAAASKAVAEKRDRLLTWAQMVPIEVAPVPADVDKRAARFYAEREWFDDGPSGYVGFNGVVAYLRHNYTNYEDLLQRIEGHVGCDLAYPIIKRRANDAVVAKWNGEERKP